jgi:hypothetical protein
MSLAEQILAGIVLAVCAVMLVRLALGESRRHRFDAAAAGAAQRAAAWWRTTVRRTGSTRNPAKEQAKVARAAAREAEAVIRRARTQSRSTVSRDADVSGNVIHPKAFRRTDDGTPSGREIGQRDTDAHRGNDTRH